MKILWTSFIIVLMLIPFKGSTQVYVENGDYEPQKPWKFTLEPYLLFPNMNGTSGLGALPDLEVDANPGDVFSNLRFGMMLQSELSNGTWSVGSDIIYMNLKEDVSPGVFGARGELGAKQFAWEVSGLYQVKPWLELGVGGLLNSLSLEVDVRFNNLNGGVVDVNRKNSQTWFDPMLIAQSRGKFNKDVFYVVRGEIGGFGIGSDFAWQARALAGYRFSRVFYITGGYRAIGLDYQKDNSSGEGLSNNRFSYDMTIFGPEIRFGFNF